MTKLQTLIEEAIVLLQEALATGNADHIAFHGNRIGKLTKGLRNMKEVEGMTTLKVAINNCYGGFGLSPATEKATFIDSRQWRDMDIAGQWQRANPFYIEELERFIAEHGIEATYTRFSRLLIVEVDNTRDWFIDDYDGMESIVYRDEE